MGGGRMLKGRSYILKLATQTATAQVSEIKYLISMDTLEELASRTLDLNDVAVCNLTTNRPLVIEPYADNRHLGGFTPHRPDDERDSRRRHDSSRLAARAQHPVAEAVHLEGRSPHN